MIFRILVNGKERVREECALAQLADLKDPLSSMLVTCPPGTRFVACGEIDNVTYLLTWKGSSQCPTPTAN